MTDTTVQSGRLATTRSRSGIRLGDRVFLGLSRGAAPYEVRVRVAGRTASLAEAARIGEEVETLYTNGPAGGGGAWKSAREVLGVVSVLVPAEVAVPAVHWLEA